MSVYAKKIVSDFLRTHEAIAAFDARVVGKTPKQTTQPWVRVTLIDAQGDRRSRADHLIDFLLQCDCYAGTEGGQPEADRLALAVRAALHDDLPGERGDAVVTAVLITGHGDRLDTDFEPARPRVIVDASVFAHSVATGS